MAQTTQMPGDPDTEGTAVPVGAPGPDAGTGPESFPDPDTGAGPNADPDAHAPAASHRSPRADASDLGAETSDRAAGASDRSSVEPTSTTAPEPKRLADGDMIELTVPALTTYLSVVRTATAGLAARLSFTFDEIEDLRIAVDEACVMLLSLPGPKAPEATLTCRFRVLPDALAVTVSAPVAADAVMPGEQSFAWQVLIAHAAEVTGAVDEGRASVELQKRRRTQPSR